MRGKPTHDTPPIQSLDRGLAILEAVAASAEPVPLKQLTDLIGIDRSSVFRLANTLRQRRFLANPEGQQRLRAWAHRLAAVAPVRPQRPRDVLPSVSAGSGDEARRDVAFRGARGRSGVLRRPSHADGPGDFRRRADGRVRAAALHGAWQGAARRLRPQGSQEPVRTGAAARLHPQHDHLADDAWPGVRPGSRRRIRARRCGVHRRTALHRGADPRSAGRDRGLGRHLLARHASAHEANRTAPQPKSWPPRKRSANPSRADARPRSRT